MFEMLRVSASTVVLLCSCIVPAQLFGQSATYEASTIGNREEPTETQQLAFAKGFCVAMRRHHDTKDVSGLKGYFDPQYLEEHDLLEGEFTFEMAPVGSIHNIVLAHDRRTILCLVETDNSKLEAILLRTIVHDRKQYLSPVMSPDQTTGTVTPWILRTEAPVPNKAVNRSTQSRGE